VRKTFATLSTPWKTTYNDDSNNRHPFEVYLTDTSLLAPAKTSLATLGDWYQFPKIKLRSGMIEHMDVLLRDNPTLFREYAIRDAEIAARHAWAMIEFAEANMGLERWDEVLQGEIPPTAKLRALVQNEWIVGLFLKRRPGQKISRKSLISLRDMIEEDADLVSEETETTLNMEFDWKRELVDPHETDAVMALPQSHFAANSKPWMRIDDFERQRALFDQWRTKRSGVLKTMADWESWTEYRKSGDVSKKGIRRTGPGIIGQVKRNFLCAYVNGLCDYKGIAAFLTLQGYET
jgi:hypothetical protein